MYLICRKEYELYENEVLQECKHVNTVWAEVDYNYISLYLGEDYRKDLISVELAREVEARALHESRIRKLEEQRNKLLKKLMTTKHDAFLNAEVELSQIAEILRISRAFVFSYFIILFGPEERP